MQVVHVAPVYAPAWRFGGTVRSVTAIAEATAAQGARVTVVTTGVGTEFEGSAHPVWVCRNGVDVCYCPARVTPAGLMSSAADEVLASVCRSATVGHLTSCWVPMAIGAVRVFRRLGLPYVSSPRGALNQYSLRRKWWKKWPYFALYERKIQQAARTLHATSPLEAADLRRYFPAHDIQIIPNICVASRWFDDHAAGDDWRREHGIGRDRLLLLYAGRVEPKKNLGFLGAVHRVIARSTKVTLAIVGPQEPHALARLEAEFRGSATKSLLTLPGTGDDGELRAAYSAANVFVLPSLQENFANVVVEAALCGTPVVASPHVGVALMIDSIGGATVVDLDPSAWSRAILTAARHRLDARVRDELGTMFSPGVVATALRRLYRRIEKADPPDPT